MEIVYLLCAIIAPSLVALLVYMIVSMVTNRVNKDAKRDLIKNAIVNKDKDCSACDGNCEKFVDGVIDGSINVDVCPKIKKMDKTEIKEVVGISPKASKDKIAVVLCKGGARSTDKYGYTGVNTCAYSNKLYDGLKQCNCGCQGCMDCAKVCPTGALKKNKVGVAEVDRSLCIGCGECVKVCPDELIRLININEDVILQCKQAENLVGQENVQDFCGVGCTKCKKCVNICPTGAIYEENGLIKINADKCNKCDKCVYVCPNNSITKITSDFLNF